MTDKEIIKAFELCATPYIYDVRTLRSAPHWCDSCPLRTDPEHCKNMLAKYTLDLINHQKAEIERLREAKVVFETVDYSSGDLEEALKEIDRLKVENESLRMAGNSLKMHLKNAEKEIESLTIDNEIKSQKRANLFEILNAYERGKAEAINSFEKEVIEIAEGVEFQNSTEKKAFLEILQDLVRVKTEEKNNV